MITLTTLLTCIIALGFSYVIGGLIVGGDVLWFTKPRIELTDAWDVRTVSRLNKYSDGTLYTYAYPAVRVGHVILNEDGTTDPNSEATYIKSWRKL